MTVEMSPGETPVSTSGARMGAAPSAADALEPELEALLESTRELSSTQSLDALLQMIAEKCGRLLDSPSVGIRLLEGDELVNAGLWGDAADLMRTPRLKLGESLSGIVGVTGEPLVVSDLAQDTRMIAEHVEAVRRSGYKHWLGVPLKVDRRLVGVLSIRIRRDGGFSQRDVIIATAFAAQAAIAVQNARLYVDAERRRQTAERLADVGRLISQSLDLHDVAQRVVDNLRSLIPALRAAFYRTDPASDDLIRVADSNDGAITISPNIVFRNGTGIVGLACQERRLVVSPNILSDARIRYEPELQAYWESTPIRATMAMPLLGATSILGVIIVGDREGRTFTEDEQHVLEMFAAQATVALDNARLFLDSERRRQSAEALAEVGRLVSQALDPGEVAQGIVDGVCRLLRCDAATLHRVDPVSGECVRLAIAGEAGLFGQQAVVPPGMGLIGLAVRDRRPVVTTDLVGDPRVAIPAELRARMSGAPRLAGLMVPLVVQDRVIGGLAAVNQTGGRFDAAQVQLAQTFADQAVLCLENTRLYAEAKHAYAELSNAQAQLVRFETLRAVGELAAGAAHHLNNLLAVVLGRVQLSMHKFHDADLHGHLRAAERAAQDGAEVVARLLRFSRREMTAAHVSIDLNELAAEVIELTRSRWQNELAAKGLTVDVGLERGTLPLVAGDPPSLREVFVNLILNGVDAMPHGGRVTITTWAEANTVRCRVSDTGDGMSSEVQRRALEPFFTTKGVKSTGLGLSVNYGILQRHGGDLSIDSVPGRGTDVTLTLPAGRPTSDAAAPAAVTLPAPLRVLVVDDETHVRTVIAEMLALDGHDVIQAASGAEALAIFADDPRIDLVLTDLGMQGVTGWDLARSAKAARSSVVVGVITGWGEEPEATEQERAGADFVLSKPVGQDELRRAAAHGRPREEAYT